MDKSPSWQWKHRPLLTETLPYEVPVIFSNEKFFKLFAPLKGDVAYQSAVRKLQGQTKRYTIPYDYKIRKTSSSATNLSIVHPLWQIELCKIYHEHEGSLLSHCNRSAFSIRYPTARASVYSDWGSQKEDTASKDGIAQIDPMTEEIDTSHIVSYFVYGRFNLLGKFFESKEFIKLEAHFPYLRTLDISKCFYHIYTHSISWAVKDKRFAKDNIGKYSFDTAFDDLMQRANHNETNGIVVGPEISRLFAEIILQRIDVEVETFLREKHCLHHNVDYAVRRYVDDYSVFCKERKYLDVIETAIATILADFKLYLNPKKLITHERPFISALSLAKAELIDLLEALEKDVINFSPESSQVPKAARRALKGIRGIVKSQGVDLSSISGLLMSSFRRLIGVLNGRVKDINSTASQEIWLAAQRSMLEMCFYVCSVDLRVRTTYSLCQILDLALGVTADLPKEIGDGLRVTVFDELLRTISGYSDQNNSIGADPVELYNLLIGGANTLGADFVESPAIESLLVNISQAEVTYFSYISIKFCFLKSEEKYAENLLALNKKVNAHLLSKKDLFVSSETYLLFFDYLSAPDVEDKAKRKVFDTALGGTLSQATMNDLAQNIGFVDWEGITVRNTLRRRELRPVYAVA